MAWVYVQNPTGGVFAGDRLETRVEAGPGARVHLTTQSATKLYRMDGSEARQTVEFTVGDGAFVEYGPDLMIPHAGSSLTQRVSVRLGKRASFIGVELIAPGRLARGEAFAYERVDLTFEAVDGRSELLVDTLVLEPSRRSPARRGLLGPRPYFGTFMVLAPDRDMETLGALLDAEVPEVAAAGVLPGGAGSFARVLAPTAPSLREAVTALWNVARMYVVGRGLPRRRK
jgi:urease accessory protein